MLLPSRRRVTDLRNFFTSLKETEATLPGRVLVDSKDYADNMNAYGLLERELMPKNWEFYISKSESMGDKVREVWNTYRKLDWVGILNDDHYAITKEWDKRLLSQLNGKNFITCNDNWHANGTLGRAAGATIWSGPLIRAVGYIFPRDLQHTCIDNVWEMLGRQTKCWIVDMDVVIEHRHRSKGEAPMDETHKKMEDFHLRDCKTFSLWYLNQYQQALMAIRSLQR